MLNKLKIYSLFALEDFEFANFINRFEFPWEILPNIKKFFNEFNLKNNKNYTEIEEGIFIGKNVKISKNATLIPPVVIGENTEIRPGAYIRGNVIIGKNCVIGNSTELKNCVLLNYVQVPHYNYVGDSVLGNHSHLGAGVICSNLKSDGKNVVIRGEENYETNLRKLGAILGDYVEVGCNSVLNPGTIIGKGTRVYPLTSLRGVYEENKIVKDTNKVVEKN